MTLDWDLMQWLAMVATVGSSWLLTSTNKHKRFIGFIGSLVSNMLWTLWAWPAGAFAVVTMQVCLAALNICGLQKNQ